MDTLYQVVDGSAIFTRVMKGTEDVKKDGLNNCLEVLKQFNHAPPYNTILVFDKEGNGMGRRKLSSDYKPVSDDPVKKAEKVVRYRFLRKCQDLMANLGYVTCSPEKLKADADDLISLLANNLGTCVIYTQDSDLLQLQSASCAVLDIDGTPLEERIDFPTRFTTLRKSIVGKPNETKGVPRMGAKAFANLLKNFGEDGLEELEDIAKGVTSKADFAEAVEANAGDNSLLPLFNNYMGWRTAYTVASMHPEWLTEGAAAGIAWDKRVPLPLGESTDEYLASLNIRMGKEEKVKLLTVAVLPSRGQKAKTLKFLSGNTEDLVAFDYETTNRTDIKWHVDNFVSAIDSEITGGSWCSGYNLNRVVYIPTDHKDSDNWSAEEFRDFASHHIQTKKSVAHNLTFEYVVSRNSVGIPAKLFPVQKLYDTAAVCSLLDHPEPSGLKHQSKTHLRYHQASYAETLEHAGVSNMAELTAHQVFQYGIDDALVTAHLFALQRIKAAVMNVDHLLQDTVSAQIELAEAYIEGTLTDWNMLEKLTKEAEEVLAETLPKIRKGLASIATEQDEKRASAFFDTIRDDLIQLGQYKKIDPMKLSDQMDRVYDGILTNTQYVEYVEEDIPVAVTPSPTFMATVMPALSLPLPEKMTKTYLYGTYFGKTYTEEQSKFVEAMLAAIPFFASAKRAGEEWETFKELCLKYTTKTPTKRTSGFECSLASPTQKQHLLYGMLGLPIRMRSKPSAGSSRQKARIPGSPATDDKAISLALAVDLKDDESGKAEVLQDVLTYTTSSTKLSLFYHPWKNWRHHDDRMRPQFRVNHTVTRRPGGSSPNFLQLPGKGGVRNVFYAGEGRCFLSIDFANQELRIMADVTGDEGLKSCYLGDDQKNVHTLTATAIAEKVYRGYFPQVEKDITFTEMKRGGVVRSVQDYAQFLAWSSGEAGEEHLKAAQFCRSKRAKACNFTVAFGGTGHALSGNILVPLEEAEEYIDDLHTMYPRIREGQEACVAELDKKGYVRNAYGAIYRPSRRTLNSRFLRGKAGRTAFNFKMQGTAAHVLYETLDNFNARDIRERYNCKVFYPIYDEIVVNCPADPKILMPLCKEIDECMSIIPPGHEIPQVAEFTLHQNRLETGTELGVIAEVSEDKMEEVLRGTS